VRLALLIAAPFPLHQGSQIFVADQARALAKAGADPVVVCYGAGKGRDPEVPVVRTPARVTPSTLRSSAHPAKLLADAALGRALARAHRAAPFDAVLAHNSEATAVALAARRRLGVPVVYVVHTLLRHELSAYGPAALGRALDAAGGVLARALARRVDATLALCEDARAELAPHARGPVEVIPPGLDPRPAPGAAACEAACRRHGLPIGGFALYAGNVDRYQDLGRLDAAAALVPDVPVVVATHDAAGARFAHLRVVEVADSDEARTLLHASALAVLPRRRPGGFPIKLLNYMEAARPILAHQGVGAGLVHDASAWLLPREAGPEAWAEALAGLRADPARAARLGRAARAHLETHHAWGDLAARTLALVRQGRGRF
jgi:glycosyltransferase involved in cell wall biosynthesis